MPIGSIISAGANIIGGLLGSSSTNKANKMTAQMAADNIENQRLFAKKGIRWRVEDAKAAGIHPLAALGAQTHSFSPVSVGYTPDMSMANAISNAGQDISRGINATRTQGERVDAYTKTVQDLQLQRLGLENELLGAQIAKVRQTTTPPFPGSSYMIPGQTESGLVEDKPLERVVSRPDQPYAEPAAVPEVGYMRSGENTYVPVKSKDATERLEDDTIGNILWSIRNRVAPSLGINESPPPKSALPDGYDAWAYNPFTQQYEPAKYRLGLRSPW